MSYVALALSIAAGIALGNFLSTVVIPEIRRKVQDRRNRKWFEALKKAAEPVQWSWKIDGDNKIWLEFQNDKKATKIKPTRPKASCLHCHNDLATKRECVLGAHVGCLKLNAPKPWSKKWSYCMVCESTKRPHHGKGLCRSCYWAEYERPSRKK